MAGGNNSVDYSAYDAEALKQTFLETKATLDAIRKAILVNGFWVDSKYNITQISDLEDDHLIAIIRMLKNQSVKRSRSYRGLHDKSSEEFLMEHSAYEHLYDEAQNRNLPGADHLPNPRGEDE